MVDPVSIVLASAAAGGVAGKIAEKAIDFLHELVRGQGPAVQKASAENALAMLLDLQARLKSLEEGQVEAALRNPDVAATLREGIVGAARTSDESKHRLLARAVAERVVAKDESTHALASNLAVEIVPRLTLAQLNFLAVAALVYAVRPDGLPLEENASLDNRGAVTEAESEAIRAYLPWLKNMLSRLDLRSVRVAETDEAHLVSNGCIVRELSVRRDLIKALTPFGPRILTIASSGHLGYELTEYMHLDNDGREIQSIWNHRLEHVTLTPTGTLIGSTYLELRTGHDVDVERAMSTALTPGLEVDDGVWDGRYIREDFLRTLDDEIKSRIERGVGPWYDLNKRGRGR